MFDFSVKKDKSKKLYIKVFEEIREAIEDGRLKKDDRLPAIRSAAKKLEVNTSTIVKAYDLLEREGYLYKIVGSGSYVGEVKTAKVSSEEKEAMEELWDIQPEDRGKINFAGASPSSDLFPVEDFRRAINTVLDREGGEAFSYEDARGYKPLREKMVEILERDGIEAESQNIQIVSGSQQAIDIAGRMLIKPGDKVIVEEPTYPGAISSFKRAGAHIISVPMEKDGMNLKKLRYILEKEKGVKFIYTIINFQNPTGIFWSEKKKVKLLELVERYRVRVVEDDCMSEIYYSPKKPKSLKAYDRNNQVIYIKSFSKILMPGLRFAFMLLPQELAESAAKIKYMADISSSGLTQRAFHEYLECGNIDVHLKKIRRIFKRRYRYMKKLLGENERIKIYYPTYGGLFFWLALPEWMDGEKFSRKAYERGLLLFSGNRFFQKGSSNPFVRVSFANATEEEIEEGVRILNETLEEY